ncbi:winged helix-turn-helix domain-containing protein [Ruminococcaceae bacterium OttesenSCG-928-D13]|nr:winged helix-turn-helix domain-containing protein [Ruminococcaceae bacterium OttesenSCG-928-D13]
MRQTKSDRWTLFPLLFAILLLCYYVWQLKADYTAQIVVRSDTPVWDLRDVDMATHYVRTRGGQAEFVPNAYLTPEAFETSSDIQTGAPEDAAQFYTARVRLLVPDGRVYALYFSSVDYTDSIYINGQHMQTVGQPGTSAETNVPQTTFVYYTVTPVNGVIEVLHQCSNFVHKEGGNPAGLNIGSVESISRYHARQTLGTAIILGCLLLLAAVHFMLFLLLKSYRTNLYFALFCLVLLLRTGVTGTKAVTALYPDISWYVTFRMEYMAIPAACLLLTLALGAMFPGLVQKQVKIAILAGNAAVALLYLLAPTVFITQALPVAYAAVLLTGGYLIGRFVLRLRRGLDTEHLIMLCALVVLVYVMVREMLYHADILIFPAAHSGMLDFGVLMLALFQMVAAFYGTVRQVAAARQNEEIARLEAEALRRDALLKEALHKAIPKEYLVVRGPLTLNTQAGQAFLSEEDLLLTPKEFTLLHLLMQHEGEAVPGQRLYEDVWKQPADVDTRTLRSTVSRLRKKLEKSGYIILNIKGRGYVFAEESAKNTL